MEANRSIQSEQTNSLSVTNVSEKVVNLEYQKNNHQFLFSHSPRVEITCHESKQEKVSQQVDVPDINPVNSVEAKSREIICQIFQEYENNPFDKNSSMHEIVSYYKNLVVTNNPNTLEYDLKHILKVIITYICVDFNYDEIASDIEISEDKIIHKDGYSIVGPGYYIVKKPCKGEGLFILNQEQRFKIGTAAKVYNAKLKFDQKKAKTTKKCKDIIEISEVSFTDNRGRHSTKNIVVLDQPTLIDIGLSTETFNNGKKSPFEMILNSHIKNLHSLEHEGSSADGDDDVIIRDNILSTNNISEILYDNDQIHWDLLYYTTNAPVKKLEWDGSYLGKFDKGAFEIVKTQITLGNKYILINLNGEQFWSEYIKLSEDDNHFLLGAIDEWKPLFGLDKIGTHFITLDRKKLMLFKTPDPCSMFKINKYLSDVNPKKVSGNYLEQIRKIILFKYIIGTLKSRKAVSSIRLDLNNPSFHSFTDMNIRECQGFIDLPKSIVNKWLTDKQADGNYDKDQYLRTLSINLKSLLNIETVEDKEIKPCLLRSNMENIGRRINSKGESNYCISFIISRVQNLIDCY